MKIIPRAPRSAGPGNTPFGSAPDGPPFPKMDHVAAACSMTALPRISGGCPAEQVSLLLPYMRHTVRGGIAVETAFLESPCINFRPFDTFCRITSMIFLLTTHTSCFVGGQGHAKLPPIFAEAELVCITLGSRRFTPLELHNHPR